MRTIAKATTAAVGQYVATNITTTALLQKALDLLIADGFTSESDFRSPKSAGSTVSKEEFDALNKAIIGGFPPEAQATLAAEVAALDEAGKVSRRYWQQQVGARRNDFARALKKRKGRTAGVPRTPEQVISDQIAALIERIRGMENARFNANLAVKKLQEAKKAVNTAV